MSLSGTVGIKASLLGREVCLPMSWSVGFKQIVCMKVWTWQGGTCLLYKERLVHGAVVRKVLTAITSVHDLIYRRPWPSSLLEQSTGWEQGRLVSLLPLKCYLWFDERCLPLG